MLSGAIWLFLSWLIAGIPTGLILATLVADTDITREGSHNIGATNVARVLGKDVGLMTLFGDILKGFLPVLGALLLLESVELASLCAVVCFCGHCWSPYLAFRGGKGVATAAGGMLALSPFIVAGAVLTWSLLFMWKRIASVSALGGAAVLPLLSLGIDPPLWPVCTALSLGILVRHRDNIRRLRDGREESWR